MQMDTKVKPLISLCALLFKVVLWPHFGHILVVAPQKMYGRE